MEDRKSVTIVDLCSSELTLPLEDLPQKVVYPWSYREFLTFPIKGIIFLECVAFVILFFLALFGFTFGEPFNFPFPFKIYGIIMFSLLAQALYCSIRNSFTSFFLTFSAENIDLEIHPRIWGTPVHKSLPCREFTGLLLRRERVNQVVTDLYRGSGPVMTKLLLSKLLQMYYRPYSLVILEMTHPDENQTIPLGASRDENAVSRLREAGQRLSQAWNLPFREETVPAEVNHPKHATRPYFQMYY